MNKDGRAVQECAKVKVIKMYNWTFTSNSIKSYVSLKEHGLT